MSTPAADNIGEVEQPRIEIAPIADYLPALDARRRRLIAWGFLVIVIGFGGLGAWAALAPLQSAAVATGVVKVSSERKTIQHLEGGIIKEILVKEGDRVQQDQVLIRLDDTRQRAGVQVLQDKLDRMGARLARLEAEQGALEEIPFPKDLVNRQDDERVSRLIAGEKEVFKSRREAIEGEIGVLEQRIPQYNEQIAGLKTQIVSTQTQLGTIKEEKDAVETLYKKGVYEKPRFLELKRSMARLQGQLGAHRSSIAQVEERIGEVGLRIIDVRRKRREEIDKELQSVQSEIFDTRERLSAAKDALERTDIRAPQDGTVVGLSVHTIGGVIRGGNNILGIVPIGDALVIEAKVRPQDIDVVHVGLTAEVRLTAFNSRNTPVLPGTVTRVSADSFIDESSGIPFYSVRVEIDPEHTGDLLLYPGMPAEVYLLTGEQTALTYLLKPIESALRRGLLEE